MKTCARLAVLRDESSTRPRGSPVEHSSPTTTIRAAACSEASARLCHSHPRKGWAIETTALAVGMRGDERPTSAGPLSWRPPN